LRHAGEVYTLPEHLSGRSCIVVVAGAHGNTLTTTRRCSEGSYHDPGPVSLTPPRSPRKSWLRRLTAGVLVAVLGVTLIGEPLLADVCDGDAPAAAREAVLPHSDLGSLGDSNASASPSRALRGVGGASSRSPSGPTVPSESQHDVHVCHCVHAHGGTLGRHLSLSQVPSLHSDATMLGAERVPPSAALEPPLRPPAPRHTA